MIDKTDTPLIFNRIARRYDLLNNVLSFGRDKYWRRKFVKLIPGKKYDIVVDIATGTGDVLVELKKINAKEYYGIDPAEKMLEIARRKFPEAHYITATAEKIPFADDFCELVTIAFGIRNFNEPDKALGEIYRILKPGGILSIMEFNFPKNRLFSVPYTFYFNHIMTFIGRQISGDKTAYSYLNNSVKDFNKNYNIKQKIQNTGFNIINQKSLSLGILEVFVVQK